MSGVIDLLDEKLKLNDLNFTRKPILIGGMAMEYSCNFINRAVRGMEGVFNAIPQNKEEQKMNRIYNAIAKRPDGVTRSIVMQNTRVLAKEFDAYIDTLKQLERVWEVKGDPIVYFAVKPKE